MYFPTFVLMKEIFKDIPGYEGLYQISNKGTVKNLIRNTTTKGGIGVTGYIRTTLTRDGAQKTKRIHQLVAMAFLNHTPNGHKLVVDHIDNNKLNNNVENLQLITTRENTSKDRRGGSSKYVGVTWNKRDKKWRSEIRFNGKKKQIGLFKTEIEAHNAYQNKLKEINNEKN